MNDDATQIRQLLYEFPQDIIAEVMTTGYSNDAQEELDQTAIPLVRTLAAQLGITEQRAAIGLAYALLSAFVPEP